MSRNHCDSRAEGQKLFEFLYGQPCVVESSVASPRDNRLASTNLLSGPSFEVKGCDEVVGTEQESK